MLKLIHCADIHFDSGLDLSDKSLAAIRRKEQRESFSGMFEYAAEQGADAIVIAGDLFDRRNITKATLDYLCSLFAKYSDIRVVIAPGGGDFYSADSVYALAAFPENVHVFKNDRAEEPFSFTTKDETKVNIFGSAYTSPSLFFCPFEKVRASETDAVNILLASGSMKTDGGRAADFTVSQIIGTGVDYAALGGVHAPAGLFHDEGNMWYAYAGALEPVGREDVGERGFIFLEGYKEDSDFICKPRFIRAAKREYASETLNVGGCSSKEEILRAANGFLESIKDRLSERIMLSLTLCGDVSPEAEIPEKEIREAALSYGVFDFDFTDCTVPLYNYEYLSADSTIRGALFNAFRPAICSDDKEASAQAAQAFRTGLAALDGKGVGIVQG